EDRLSDALHERLTQRFVDKRTSVLMKRLQGDDKLIATVDASSDVLVEGHYVGRLTGLSFEADEMAQGQEGAVLINAAGRALRRELDKRIARIQKAGDAEFELDVESGEILFEAAPIARLTAGPSPLEPQIEIIASDFVEPASQQVVRDRISAWLTQEWRERFAPLLMLKDSLDKGVDEKGRMLNGLARGIAFQLLENLGSMPRDGIRKELKSLSSKERWQLRAFGVRFAEASIYMPLLLKPAFAKLRLLAWSVYHGVMPVPEAPPAGLTSVPREDMPEGYYEIAGFREIGQRAVRLDMLERVAEKAREKAEKGPFEVEQEMMSVVGCTGEDFAAILKNLGYRPQKTEHGTVLYARKKPGKRPPRRKQQQSRRRQADSPFAELEQLKRAMRTG
ncbi:MAG: disulfide oxidoreductase, partial [Alphaproteobacteria bacterium]|nr:disulfide oxidoreductase [Alphaproteobacteria bacterium]